MFSKGDIAMVIMVILAVIPLVVSTSKPPRSSSVRKEGKSAADKQ